MASITKRTNKKGEVTYKIRVSCGYQNGVQQTKTCSWKPNTGMTKRDIAKALDEQVKLLEQAAENDQNIDFQISFCHLADEWIDLMEQTKSMKQSSIERLKTLRGRTYSAFGNTPVKQLCYRQIQNFIVSLSKPGTNQSTGGGLSEKTQKHYLSFISDVMGYAIRCGIITDNPCKNVITVKTQQAERTPYTLDEEVVLLERLKQKASAQYCAFFMFMIYCGLRRGEVMGLEWKDIDLDSGKCSIVRTSLYQGKNTGVYTTTPKTKNSRRTLIIPDELITQLRLLLEEQNEQRIKCGDQWQESDRLIISWNGTPMHPNSPYYFLYKFCKDEGLPFKGLHSFRHSFATNAIVSGQIDIKTVSAILGHSQVSTTLNIYTHEVAQASAEALNTVADIINGRR